MLSTFQRLDGPPLSCVLNQLGNSIQLEVWTTATFDSIACGSSLHTGVSIRTPASYSLAYKYENTLNVPFSMRETSSAVYVSAQLSLKNSTLTN